jgi:N-acetyl-gamma-glutamyl-phosphate reductase
MRVANPGCYPTGFLALVAPLVAAKLLPADLPLSVNATSGYSGGGKAMIAEFEAGSTATAFRAYALGLAHKHIAEMTQHAGLVHAPIFAPAVANAYRGMVVEVPLHLHALPGRPSLAAIEDVLRAAFDGSTLVSVAAGDIGAIDIEENAGTDRLTLRVCGNDAVGHARLVATLDNLGKGAGGAAVQNLNIMAGVDPVAGLVF